MGSSKRQNKDLLQPIKLVFMTLASYPLLIVLFGIFSIYRSLIDIILRIKYGEKYGGLYDKQDSLFFTKGANPCITSVLILKSKKERDVFNDFKETVREKIFSNPDNYPKLTGLLAMFGGYPFIIKNGCDMNKCVNPLPVPEDVEFDENYFKELTGSILSKPFPQNNAATFEFLPSPKPFKRNKNDRYYYYPIVIRFYHCVADGNSLMAFVLRLFGDDNTETYSKQLHEKLFKKKLEKKSILKTLNAHMKKIIEILRMSIYIFFMGVGKFTHTHVFDPVDQNVLHGPILSKNRFVAWTAENYVKYVPMVKTIKSRTNSKFSAIIFTAITAGLTNYFKRNSYPIPESTKALIPITLSFPKLHDLKPVPLKNKFSSFNFEMPSHNYSTSVTDTIQKVTEKSNEVNYWDILANKMMYSQMGVFPIQMLQAIPTFQSQTTLVTNVPGGTQVKLLGCIVDKLIPLAPNYAKITVTISILTYDDRFQIGIIADKVVIKSQKDVQLLVDDIYQYIELLEQETRSIEKKHY